MNLAISIAFAVAGTVIVGIALREIYGSSCMTCLKIFFRNINDQELKINLNGFVKINSQKRG